MFYIKNWKEILGSSSQSIKSTEKKTNIVRIVCVLETVLVVFKKQKKWWHSSLGSWGEESFRDSMNMREQGTNQDLKAFRMVSHVSKMENSTKAVCIEADAVPGELS